VLIDKVMIDLEKLDKEIDELFEQETANSLLKWLLNKRLGNIDNLIGSGTFDSRFQFREYIRQLIKEYEEK